MDLRHAVRVGKVCSFLGVLLLLSGLLQTGAGATGSGWKPNTSCQSSTHNEGHDGHGDDHEGEGHSYGWSKSASSCTTVTTAKSSTSVPPTTAGCHDAESDSFSATHTNGCTTSTTVDDECGVDSDDEGGHVDAQSSANHDDGDDAQSCVTTTTQPHQTTTTIGQQGSTTTTAPAETTTTTVASASTTTTAAVGGSTTTTATVLGVQFSRGSETPRGLASTGATFFRPMTMFGALLLLIGVTLMTIRVRPQARA